MSMSIATDALALQVDAFDSSMGHFAKAAGRESDAASRARSQTSHVPVPLLLVSSFTKHQHSTSLRAIDEAPGLLAAVKNGSGIHSHERNHLSYAGSRFRNQTNELLQTLLGLRLDCLMTNGCLTAHASPAALRWMLARAPQGTLRLPCPASTFPALETSKVVDANEVLRDSKLMTEQVMEEILHDLQVCVVTFLISLAVCHDRPAPSKVDIQRQADRMSISYTTPCSPSSGSRATK